MRQRVQLNTESTALLTALDWIGLDRIRENRISDERGIERGVVRLGVKGWVGGWVLGYAGRGWVKVGCSHC